MDSRKIMDGRSLNGKVASNQFKNGDNTCINAYKAKSETDKIWNSSASYDLKKKALLKESAAFEKVGWNEAKKDHIQLKKKLQGE